MVSNDQRCATGSCSSPPKWSLGKEWAPQTPKPRSLAHSQGFLFSLEGDRHSGHQQSARHTALAPEATQPGAGTGPVCCEDGTGSFSSVCPVALWHGTEAEEQPLCPLVVPPGYGTGDMRSASAWVSRAVFSGRTQTARRCRVEEGREKRERVSFLQQDLVPCTAPLCSCQSPQPQAGGVPQKGRHLGTPSCPQGHADVALTCLREPGVQTSLYTM